MKIMKTPWASEIIYQIYPRSFKDSNSDGIGDIKGIIEKLNYIKDLGIGSIWISPMYMSPMADFGYDVSDYCDIDPIFGNLNDFDRLIQEAHKRKIKIIMDYIPSHTSTKHPWFLESRSSKDNPKRDWYIWKKGKSDKMPPNNWLSVFGGSMWELDKKTSQYYLHSFLKEQADLNWRNPDVQDAMLDVLRFWLDKGVDGFRVDAFDHIFKDERFLDEPQNPNYKEGDDPFISLLHVYTKSQNELYDLIKKLSEVLKQYGDKFLITESYVSMKKLISFYMAGDISHAPFNFQFIELPWKASLYKKFIDEFDRGVGMYYLPTYVLGNHDKHRVASRLGSHGARVAGMLQLTLRGMPTIYYGEEIGMKDGIIPKEMVQDPWEKNVPGKEFGRDPERTPMQWNSGKHAGFSDVEPWLPISDNYSIQNVEKESEDSKSMLSLYKTLIGYRRQSDALLFGHYESIAVDNDDVFVYSRSSGEDTLLVILNFSKKNQKVSIGEQSYGTLVCSTYLDKDFGQRVDLRFLVMRPHEGYLLKL